MLRICASAILLRILSSVHVPDARGGHGSRADSLCPFQSPLNLFSIRWSQFSSNCTSIMLPSTWVSRCGNDSKFEVLALTGHSVHSFPNPVPVETRVPQWAFLDVTVRCYLSFPTCHVLMTQPRLRIIGTPTSRQPSVVGTFLLAILRLLHSYVFLDNPEITSPSTSPSPSGRSASFYGTIAGAVGGGIALIAGIAILWGIHLRRRHSQTQSSVIVANSAAHLHIGSTNTLADDGTRESSLMPGAPPVIVHVCWCVHISLVAQNLTQPTQPL